MHALHALSCWQTHCLHGFPSIMKLKWYFSFGCWDHRRGAQWECTRVSFIHLWSPKSRWQAFSNSEWTTNLLFNTSLHCTQEIDDIIRVAQDRGYMHVFRLGSESVNYANRIIMQNDHHRQQQQSSELSYQLMRNMSLSSISDVDTISSDEILNYRKYSTSSMPSSSDYDTYRRVYSTQSADLMRWVENWTLLLRLLSAQHSTTWPKFYLLNFTFSDSMMSARVTRVRAHRCLSEKLRVADEAWIISR